MQQCTRCGATLPVNGFSCPVCAQPLVAISATARAESQLPAEHTEANMLPQTTPSAGSVPGYEAFSFREFNAPVANQAYPCTPLPMPGPMTRLPVRRGKPSLGIILLSVSLALILLVAGSVGAFVYITAQRSGSSPSHQVSVTSTPDPKQLYVQATSGTPVINDTLTNAAISSWRSYRQAKYGCGFKNGAYHVSVSDPRHFFFCPSFAYKSLTDFAFQVQMTLIEGDYAGFVFRLNPYTGSLYLMRFSQSGSYYLYSYRDFHSSDSVRLTWGDSGTFDIGFNQPNTLTVIVLGSHFYFYVNKQFLKQVINTTLSVGAVGLVADDAVSPTDAVFSNAKLWILNS